MTEEPNARRRAEAPLSTALRTLVYAVTAAVIAWPLSVVEGVAAASLGATMGALSARFLAKSALRAPAIVLLGVAGVFAVAAARFVVVDLLLLPSSLGPAGALLVGEAVVFGVGGFVLSTILRALSIRHRVITIAEVGLIAGGFASLMIAHRHGAIHRPYELADPLIAMGEDPTLAILVIGAVGAGVVGLLLMSERSPFRSVMHLAVVAFLLGGILYTTAVTELPPPPSTGGALGLQDDDSEQQAGGGQGQSENGRRNADELDFRDEYPSGGGSPDAVALFHDDYSPPSGYYYFRQNAFSQFNGRKLVAATRRGIDEDVRNHFPTNRTREVAWNPGAGSDRTSVETTIAMLADNSAPVGLEAPVRFVPASNPNPQRFQRIYRTHSVPITRDPMSLFGRPEGGDPSWNEETRAHYLEMPDDPRYRALAERILAELPDHLASLRDDPVGRALAITHYLGQNGTYSLRSRHAGADDPTADFLFGDLTGYCVHFSHAAVFLMRAVGVPARVGTGYAVPEQNRAGGSALLLRNTDQHAWPEVFVGPGLPPPPQLVALRLFWDLRENGLTDLLPEQQAWIVVEALEEAALASQPDLGLTPWAPEAEIDGASLEARMMAIAAAAALSPEALQRAAEAHFAVEESDLPSAGWVVFDVAPAQVIDGEGQPPDAQLQRLLGEMARGSQPIDDAPLAPRPMRELVRSVALPAGQAALGVLFGVLLLGYAVKLYRALAPHLGPVRSRPKRLYRAALDRLSEGGRRRRWGESAEAFAARERGAFPSLRRLTDAHLATAFGGASDPARLDRMWADAGALRADLRRAVPFWRRLLGALNPFSWVLTR
ncbi:MAG: DUF4129 domain-containing transglutaminase family protein [Sandaracinaceae bacterium]